MLISSIHSPSEIETANGKREGWEHKSTMIIHGHFNPEDGGSMVLQNDGIQPPYYKAQ
jgi:hypothetical protein